MKLINVEEEIKALSKNNESSLDLRQGAILGMKASIQEIERQLDNSRKSNYLPAYIQAQSDALVYLKAMLSRIEKGEDTHPSTKVD